MSARNDQADSRQRNLAVILYLMPMYAVRRIPALAPYRGQLSNVFVTVAGLVAISGILFTLVR